MDDHDACVFVCMADGDGGGGLKWVSSGKTTYAYHHIKIWARKLGVITK